MDKREFYAAFILSWAFYPVMVHLSGMWAYSIFAVLLVYVLYIFLSALMESDYDI